MKNKYPIEYLPIAEKDLIEILEYVQIDNPAAALQLLEEIDKAISKLAYFPYMGYIPKDQRLIQLSYRNLVVENDVNARKTNFDNLIKNTLFRGKKKKLKTPKSSLTYKFG